MKKEYQTMLIIIGALIVITQLSAPAPQTVAPSCFSKEDCWQPIKEGYCGVDYDCVIGKCYSEDIGCPEECGNNVDDDADGLIDCQDSDCWDDVYCHCSFMGHQDCREGRCFCPAGKQPKWFILESSNYCECVIG